MTTRALVTDTGIDLQPDHTRVITRFYVSGLDDMGYGDSRAGAVISRVLAMDEDEVTAAMDDIDARFSHRHRALHQTFGDHADLATLRLDPAIDVSPARRLLLGASFTHEYTIEGAALCNPSAVLHPEQDSTGDAAFIVSVRGIGEGHISSIGFRTGRVTASGKVTLDPAVPFAQTAAATPGPNHRAVMHAKLAELDDDRENAAYVLDGLPMDFDDDQLDVRLRGLAADIATRRRTSTTIANIRSLSRSSYHAEFPRSTDISERVLWPHVPAESHGMEDARFVRFVDDSGEVVYYATYTAFDGSRIAQHLLSTTDFAKFTASPVAGLAAVGKGLALFPRKIRGRYAALSRSDRETNAIAFSDDLYCWDVAETIQVPARPWEILQLGNCGSPIETAAGWLVLTHGVGPMRTYSLAAMLLDLDEPQRVLAHTRDPIIGPGLDRRDGYVPNVVYSCGAVAHNDVLVIPYGVGDQSISIATLSIDQLVSSMSTER
jgi:predicted GH43/DUF377 family glycosyl hydrolase